MILKLLGTENRLEDKIKIQVAEVLEDMREKEERKNNVMLFNVEESKDVEGEKEHDRKEVQAILEHIGTQANSGVTLVRLGKRRPPSDQNRASRPRPLRVSFTEVVSRLETLKRANKLRLHPKYKVVGMAPDRTKKERDDEKVLRHELAERRGKGESVVIFRGKVMTKEEREVILRGITNPESEGEQGAVGGAAN